MDRRVSLITLGVADLARSEAFYAALGWRKAAESQEGIAFYQLAGQVLGLFPRDELAKDQGRSGAELGTGAIALAQNHASREDVDAVLDEWIAAGGTVLKEPEEAFWGGYSGYAADPDGHVWEFAMNPFWPLAPDGTLTLPGGTP